MLVELWFMYRALSFVVLTSEDNVAAGRPTRQSSVDDGASADRAIDGDVNGHYYKGSCTLTVDSTNYPWWAVDLESERLVQSVVIYNRVDGKCVQILKLCIVCS